MRTRITRARFVPVAAFAVAASLLLGACQREPARNLLLICIDTVRYDGFMKTGLPDDLDRWLESAQVYENAIATGPWTMPSVASALTGRYPVEHGAGRFQGATANLNTDPPSPLAAEANTLAEVLAERGLRTGAFVAHPFFVTKLGLDQGFELMRPNKGWSSNVETFTWWRQKMPDWRRYFAYLHFMEAHDRHKRKYDRLAERLDELGPAVRRDVRNRASRQACLEEQARRCLQHQVYNAAILELRTAIASILDGLQKSGDLDKTVVIVYSDHGEEFWEHRREQTERAEDPRESYGFGHGQSLYQELLHVPLLAWVPGKRGARHEELVSLVDILPSALQWLGFEMDGIETAGHALPLRSWGPGTGHPGRRNSDRAVFASGISFGPEKVSALKGTWKTVFTPASDRFETFDLAEDPEERQPLVERDDLLMMFDTLVGDYLEKTGSRVAAQQFDATEIEALKAIGYLQGYDAKPAASPGKSEQLEKDAETRSGEDEP